MVRRRTAVFVLVALGLAIAACSSEEGKSATTAQWHPVAASSPIASPFTRANDAHRRAPSPSPSQKSPSTPAGQTQQVAPANPPAPPTSPPSAQIPTSPEDIDAAALRGQHGPYGTITNTGSPAVALTFDDGPSAYTAQVLDLLDKYQIKATFCVIGRQVAAHADQIRRMVAEGHTLCNHTWDHDERLGSRPIATIRWEMQRTDDAIRAVVPDAKIQYFRNPGGGFSPATIQVAKSMGMSSIMWNVDPRDWAKPGTQTIINNVRGNTHPGSIVLMHDGGGDRTQTMAALPVLLPDLKSRFTLIALPTA
jgi:peptidoglycan/xylan/chitin deacetylase (PgdA/CDA1 family)